LNCLPALVAPLGCNNHARGATNQKPSATGRNACSKC
jgi:hypothetical protein